MSLRTLAFVSATASLAVPAGAAFAQEAFAFDRPGIGFGTTVLRPGEVAFEQGLPDVERDEGDGTRTTTLEAGSLLRVGLGANLELQVGGVPWTRVTERDAASGTRSRTSGAGDSSVGVKWQLPAAGELEWALLATYGLATGSAELRPRTHARNLGATVAGALPGGRGYALFAGYGEDDGGGGWQVSPSLSLFEGEAVAVYVEAGFGEGAQSGTVAGAGLTWQPRDDFQLDLSFLRGLDDDAPDWQGGFGISVGFR